MRSSSIDESLDNITRNAKKIKETATALREAAAQPEATVSPRAITIERPATSPLPKP